MAIEIISDPAKLLESTEFECVVGAVADYVSAIQRIKQAVAAEKPLRVLVRDPTCATWLERFAASYSSAVVRYSATRPRVRLAERWQTEIPEDVTDRAILDSGFLEADITPRTGQSYEEIVLEHYAGEFFTFVRFPLRLAGELIESLDPAHWQAIQALPLVRQTLETCKERWIGQATQRELKELIRAVFDKPGELKNQLGCYKLVRGYPAELGEAVLGRWYMVFKNLGIDPTPISLDGLDLGGAIQEIRYYLNRLVSKITGQADLEAVLDEMSGFLPEEFEWVVDQLRNKPEVLPLTNPLVQRIATQFQPIRDQIEAELNALRVSIPPTYPSDPAKNQTIEDWLAWAIHEYLPYRFWLEENDRWDETIAAYAAHYADWFYENYRIHKYEHQSRWVSHLLNQVKSSLAQGRKVLFIVIDNLNFKHLRFLLDQFNRHSFRLAGEVEPVWSPIPTATEISKWCLVAGELDLRNIQGRGYEDILEKDWRSYFDGYRLAYLSKLDDLKKRRQFAADLILLNYLPIDDVLHKDERQVATSHTAEVRVYLQTLADVVSQFARRAKVEQELVICIASDHGSTKIPAGVHNLLDEEFYRERIQDQHHRYIAIPESRAANPTAYDRTHCYIVRADDFGTLENYFIAREYGRFIATEESIYVHGGLTPEETIVPFCKLVKTEIEVRQPTIRLPNNVVRYSVKADLVFVVGNPNDYDMTDIELNIVESDLPGVSLQTIPAGIDTEVVMPVRIKRRPGVPALEAITVTGAFELQGQRYTIQPVPIAVEVRSLMESKTGFDFGV